MDFSDIDGLQRKLSRMLSVNEDETDHWEVIKIVFSCGYPCMFWNVTDYQCFRWEIALECGGGLTLKPCCIRTCPLIPKCLR
jgi:hypothetical protein